MAFFSLAIIAFTLAFVWGPNKPKISADWMQGNFPPGTNVDGIVWANGYSQLRINLVNERNADFNDVDFEFHIHEGVADIRAVGNSFCSVVDTKPVRIFGTDNKTGQQTYFGGGFVNLPYKLICTKIPARTEVGVEAALFDPNGKHKPDLIDVRLSYKAMGRPYNVETQISPKDTDTPN